MPGELTSRLIEHARLRDLTIFPLREEDQHGRGIVEGVIFDSGRPVLLLPETTMRELPSTINRVGRTGTIAELPLEPSVMVFLQAAKRVRIFTVIDEGRPPTGTELCDHLARHGVDATFATIRSNGCSIGSGCRRGVGWN
jgi:hypothetical protein